MHTTTQDWWPRAAKNHPVIPEEGVAPDSKEPPSLQVDATETLPDSLLQPDETLEGVEVSWYGFKSPGIVSRWPSLALN